MKGEENVEKRSYYVLNEIVETFKDSFRNENFSDSQILNALILNSMNMKKAYGFLKNPNKVNKKAVFSQAEDYILQNLKNTDRYEQLLKEKGKDVIVEREKFLK